MKSNRTLITIILAIALMVVVMVCAAGITFSGLAGREKVSAEKGWNTPANIANSINITDLTGDKQRDVFAQDSFGLKVLDGQANVLVDKLLPQPLAASLGDVNSDGTPDIVAYFKNGDQPTVIAFTGQDELLWEQTYANLGRPGRAAAVDFDNNRQSEIVVADESGQVLALSAQGGELWRYAMPAGTILRGLDNAPTVEGDIVIVGGEDGLVVAINKQGRELWRTTAGGGLRRVRAFPLGGPQEGRVFVGSVGGRLSVHRPTDGQELWSANLGQAVNEIRPAEVDGDPATTEIVVGGKDGGVWAFDQNGRQLWSASVSDKVNEVRGFNLEGGSPVILVGDDTGKVTVYSQNGLYLTSIDMSGSIGRIEVGKLADNGFIVADPKEMAFYTVATTTAPFWYSPLLAGVLACGVIAVVAFIVASVKPAPTLRVSAEGMTVEAQKARRRMLHESIADLNKIRDRGEVSGEAYLARIRDLREQLAEVNAALIKLGEPIKPETFACPNCGGPLELGTDRCEFCGQVVIM
jgi:outer membrane protein assembly factor BamB